MEKRLSQKAIATARSVLHVGVPSPLSPCSMLWSQQCVLSSVSTFISHRGSEIRDSHFNSLRDRVVPSSIPRFEDSKFNSLYYRMDKQKKKWYRRRIGGLTGLNRYRIFHLISNYFFFSLRATNMLWSCVCLCESWWSIFWIFSVEFMMKNWLGRLFCVAWCFFLCWIFCYEWVSIEWKMWIEKKCVLNPLWF